MNIQEFKSIEVLDMANFILKNYGPMSHLKLQKLLFYCEAYHLAYFDSSLINCEFEAWVHGPVCRELYDEMKGQSVLFADIHYSSENGTNPDDIFNSTLISTQKQILSDVLGTLSSWRDLELESSTHNETPWIEARKGYGPADRCNVKIDKELMRKFYKSELGIS